MKKTIQTILLLISINICVAQNYKGIAIYKKEVSYLSDDDEFIKKHRDKNYEYYINVQKMDNNVKDIISMINFKLLFANTESIFRVEQVLELEKNKGYNLAVGPDGSAVYYTNIPKKQFYHQKDAYGEKFIVSHKEKSWQLTNETKKIGNYTCYKATTFRVNNNSKGINKNFVTAWYAPALPIPHGPLGYYGLPGLIVELELMGNRYYLEKLELNPLKPIKITPPKRGKFVTREAFDAIGIGLLKSYKNGF